MINHNPYNLPERPSQTQSKHTHLFSETNTSQYRQNDSADNSHNYPQYSNRQPSRGPVSPGGLINKANLDESAPNFRPPVYQTSRAQTKQYVSGPKSAGSSSISSFSGLGNVNIRTHLHKNKSIEKLDQSNSISKRDGVLDIKQISENIQNINAALNRHQKRIYEMERNHTASSKLTTSNISDEGIQNFNSSNVSSSDFQQLQGFMNRIENEWRENSSKIRQQMAKIKQQVQICIKPSEIQHIINEKMLFFNPKEKENQRGNKMEFKSKDKTASKDKDKQMEMSGLEFSSSKKLQKSVHDTILKEIEKLKEELNEKLSKNTDFLSVSISRFDKEIKDIYTHSSMPPAFKSSAIKCSGSAILLRFVENFRVRKHGTKTGEVKITITDNTYYIDGEGYLLDKEQNYLLDTRGKQVKLEERHIKMLKQEKILF